MLRCLHPPLTLLVDRVESVQELFYTLENTGFYISHHAFGFQHQTSTSYTLQYPVIMGSPVSKGSIATPAFSFNLRTLDIRFKLGNI